MKYAQTAKRLGVDRSASRPDLLLLFELLDADGVDLVADVQKAGNVPARTDHAEDGVLAVQMGLRGLDDEELASAGSRARVGHG